jgi:tetratricopeptide (TPR) repeat protein/TolB-like protein
MARESFLERSKRARLPRVLVVYLGAAWIVLEVTDLLQDILSLPDWTAPVAFVLLLSGLLVILATAWVQSHPGLDAREAAGEVPDSWDVGVGDIGRSIRDGRLPHLTWGRAMVGGVVVFSLLFGFAGMYVLLRESGTAPGPAPLAAEHTAAPGVAVVPFSVNAPELELWREGLVDLLSTNLDGTGGLRGIDSRTVLARWSERVPDTTRPDLASMLAVAGAAGARWAVVGSLVGTTADVRLSADIYEVEGAAKVGTARAEGAADDIMGLVDVLSVEVVRLLLGEETGPQRVQHLSAMTTTSLTALQAYLEGESRYRRSEFQEAEERFQAAVEGDSLFALAWLRLHDVYGWTGVGGTAYNESADIAYRHRDRLPARDAILMEARKAMADGSPAHLGALRNAARRYPDDPELWYELGEHYAHFAGQVADAPDTALAALEKAIELDPSFGPYYIHAVDLATFIGDSARAVGLVEAQGRVTPTSSYHMGSALAFELAFGNAATLQRAWQEAETGDPGQLDWAHVGLMDLRTARQSERLARTLYDRAGLLGAEIIRSLARQGRIREAAEFQAREQVADGTRAGILAALHATRLEVPEDLEKPDTPDGEAAPADLLARGAAAVNEGSDALADIRVALARRGRVELAAGDTLESRRWLALDRAIAGYAAWRQEADFATAIREIEAARPDITGWIGSQSGRWYWPAQVVRMWLGELHAELDQPEQASFYFRSIMVGDVLVGLARYRLGEIYERLDRPGDASRAYSVFVDTWQNADPNLQPMVEDARRRLTALTAEG